MNNTTIGVRSLSHSLNLLAICKSQDEIESAYRTVKSELGCNDIDQLINKIKDVLVSNKSATIAEQDLVNIENGLRTLGRNIHMLSNSERNIFTRIFIRLFPKADYSVEAARKERDWLAKSQRLFLVTLGREERSVIDRFLIDRSPIQKLSQDPTFRQNAGAILHEFAKSTSPVEHKLSVLHQKVMALYERSPGGITKLEDYYAALVLAGGARVWEDNEEGFILGAEELGYISNASSSQVEFRDLHSFAAHKFIGMAFESIHKEKHDSKDSADAVLLNAYYTSDEVPAYKSDLGRAARRIKAHAMNPDKKVGSIATVITDKEFQKRSAFLLSHLLEESTPLEDRLQAVIRGVNEAMEQHVPHVEGKSRREEIMEENFNFYIATWVAARHELDDATYRQLETLLSLYLPTEGNASQTQALLVQALNAAREVSTWPRT